MFSILPQSNSESEVSAAVKCLQAGWVAPSKLATQLETEVARRCGKKYGLMVSTRKAAILLSCLACGISPSSKIILPSVYSSFHLAILQQLHCVVSFCEVSPEDFMPAAHSALGGFDSLIFTNILAKDSPSAAIRSGNPTLTIIEDLGCNTIPSPGSTAAVVTFESICSIILFDEEAKLQAATQIRDWGRAGNQDESISSRYSSWVLGNVPYDWKFVYNELGFNFKSCEMSAAIALEKLKAGIEEKPLHGKYDQKLLKIGGYGSIMIVNFGGDAERLKLTKAYKINLLTTEEFGLTASENCTIPLRNYAIILTSGSGIEELEGVIRILLSK